MEQTEQTNHNSNPVSKSDCNLSTAHKNDIGWSSINIYQMKGTIYVEQTADHASFGRKYNGVKELRIVVLTPDKWVIGDTTYVFQCFTEEKNSNFRAGYYKFYDIKSVVADGHLNQNVTVTLEMI